MKREVLGRQHGVVRTYAILPDPFAVQTMDSGSVTGLFTKVSRKPTNQSKFTGKCGKSGFHPAGSKSKDKAKGTMKMRSMGADLVVNKYSANGNMATSDLAFNESYDDVDVYDDDDPIIINYDLGYENTNDDDPAIIDHDLGNKTTNDDPTIINYDLGYEMTNDDDPSIIDYDLDTVTIGDDYETSFNLAFELAIAASYDTTAGKYGIGIASGVPKEYKDKDKDEGKNYRFVLGRW